jgi:hypothetical protein
VNRVYTAATLVLLAAVALAYPSYTGYSGAPGSSGACASTCHGASGGTIEVVGFPAAYELSHTYDISVVHSGGSSISNFNASVRTASGSHTTGTITAGYRTATYSTGNEPNGVHLSSNNQDSCTFSWQAPDTAVGDAKLYLAGHQGSYSGQNTVLVLTSSPMTGISEGPQPLLGLTLTLAPTVVTGRVGIRLSAPSGSHPSLRVVDRGGRLVARIAVPESGQPIVWRPLDHDDRPLAAGIYFVVLQGNGNRLVRKLVLE